MSEKTLEVMIASPPDRDEIVAQLFVKDGAQWGEIYREGGRWLLELYPTGDDEPWRLDAKEAHDVIALSLTELRSRLEP